MDTKLSFGAVCICVLMQNSHLFRLKLFFCNFEKCAHFYWPHSFFWCVVTVNNNTNTYSNLYFFFSLFSSPSHSPNSPPQSSLPKKTLHSTQHVKIKSLLHDLHPAFVQYCVHLLLVDRGTKLCEYPYHIHTSTIHFLETWLCTLQV